MGYKRIFLSIGVVMLAIAFFITVVQTAKIVGIKETDAEVVNTYTMYNGQEPKNLCVEFSVNGHTYRQNFPDSVDHPHEMGDKIKVTYSIFSPSEVISGKNYAIPMLVAGLPLAIIGGLILFFTRKGFSGYWTEFIKPHKKASITSAVLMAILVLYALWEQFIFEPQGDLGGLFAFVVLISLAVSIPVIIATIWLITVTHDAHVENMAALK